MKKLFIYMTAICMCVLTSGCMETLTLVKVKKDGSGTIMLRVYISEKAMEQMASGMGGMMGGGGEVTVTKNEKPIYDEAQMKTFAKVFGEGVQFVKGQEKKRADGWKGFVTYYKFDDITKIGVAPGIGEMLMTMGQMGGAMGGGMGAGPSLKDEGYGFSFQPGSESLVTINPPAIPESSGRPPEMGMDTGDVPPEMAQMQKQMMEAMKGKKDVIVLSVDGKISSTNSRFRSSKYPGMITLFSMDMSKLMENIKDPNALNDMDITAMADLSKKNTPGLKMEDPKKKITIKFK